MAKVIFSKFCGKWIKVDVKIMIEIMWWCSLDQQKYGSDGLVFVAVKIEACMLTQGEHNKLHAAQV